MKTLLRILPVFALTAVISPAVGAATYDLAVRDVLRTIVITTNGLSDAALDGWIRENAASELAEAGASVTGGSAAGYRLTGFRAGRGITRVRAEYALGDRLVAPADLGEIDWYATYRASVPENKENTFLFTGTGDYSDAAVYFACGGDPVTIRWIEKDGTETVRTYIVSDTASTRPYRLYRSDDPYNNGPVSLAGQYVKVIGDTSLFTLEYGTNVTVTSDGHAQTNTEAVVRGIYLTSDGDLYSVGDVKGQFLLVYYDSADYTRVRQVQVIESCTPSVKIVSAKVGDELKPSADGYETAGLVPSIVTSARTKNDNRGDFIYVHETSATYYPHRNAAFALRPTMDENDTQDHTWDATINWYAPDEMGVHWPFEQTQYSIRWGEGVKYLISTDTRAPGQLPIYSENWNVSVCDYQSPDGHVVDGETWRGTGRSLFKVTGTNAEGLADVAFIQVDAVDAAQVSAIVTNCAVGVRVTPVDPSAVCVSNQAGRSYLGYIHKPWSVTCYDPDDYVEPCLDLVKGESVLTNVTEGMTSATEAVRSDIYFVNLPERGTETLDVWWNVAVTAGDLVGTSYFPSVREKFKPVFPSRDETPQIVLASMKGSSGTSELYRVTAEGVREMYLKENEIIMAKSLPHVYAGGAEVTDGTGVGWNPNVAHAWCEAGDGGYVCWALRNDMVTHSSLKDRPLVYVKGEVAVEGEEWTARKVWTYYVVSTNAAYPKFEGKMLVGNQLPGPHPLDLARDPWLPEIYWADKVDKSEIVAYRDRKGAVWARRDGTLKIFMYYANLNEYKYTYLKNGTTPTEWTVNPPSGAAVPWNCVLESNVTNLTVNPGAWTWIAEWPSGSPTMQIGRTLTKAADGLAEVWGAASAAVVWPEPSGMSDAVESDVNKVAQLVDPTRNQTASLAGIDCSRDELLSELGFSSDPGGNCIYRDGIYYFANVPASLSRRVWYDPNADISKCLVLQGQLDEKTGGVSILYMNVLNATERKAIEDLVPVGNEHKQAWDDAVKTFALTPVRPNQHSYATATAKSGTTFTEFRTTYGAVDHYALASLGGGTGLGETNWVVWIENDADPKSGLNVAEGDAISMHVLRIVPEYYLGQSVTRTDENNLLSQLLDVLYTEPFGGSPDEYVFEWQSAEPQANGMKPGENDWRDSGYSGAGVTRFTLGSQGTMADLVNTYYRVRYRANGGTTAAKTMGTAWSDWTQPCLAEGWIQRVINSITPFTQRVTDLYENPPENTISMIQQIGGPYMGDVALNMDNMTEVGLLETYMTLLNKAESMSISMGDDASIDKTSVNKQLLQLVERLDDFYALLGNEAYSDAANPTIAWGSEYSDLYGWDYGMVSSSLFAFDNQVPTLLDEELALLRGRGVIEDETMGDDVTAYQQKPVYNRLLWNYTRGITEGEVAYSLNYNVMAGKGEIDIQAETAAEEYPQGHGDAWGHYLDGLKLWYRLLRNPSFSWSVSMGEMNVDDHAINVDYFEEEKMAEAAASLGKTAERIVDLTARKVWRDRGGAVSAADAGYEDKVPARGFGYGEWGNKGGVATFVNWMVVNSLLPAADTNETAYTDQGLLKINRSTVGELSDLANRYALIQRRVDRMNDNLNPLGFAENAVPFGISTYAAEGDESHFEQVLDGAVTALANANALLEKASASTARMNSLKDASQDDEDDAEEEERDYNVQLISYYGYPYAGDIGVGETYPQGYEGPDLYHWMYMDKSYTDPAIPDADKATTRVTVQEGRSYDDSEGGTTTTVSYDITRSGLIVKPNDMTGERRAWGSLQYAYAEYLAAVAAFNSAYSAYQVIEKNKDMIDTRYTTLQALKGSYAGLSALDVILNWFVDDGQDDLRNYAAYAQAEAIVKLNRQVAKVRARAKFSTSNQGVKISEATSLDLTYKELATGSNDDFAFSNQLWHDQIAKMEDAYKTVQNDALSWSAKAAGLAALIIEQAIDISETGYDWAAELQTYYEDMNAAAAEVIATAQAIVPLAEQVLTLKTEAEAILDEREAARQRRARKAAKSRYSEMAHRIWRDEALENYAHAFELAQKYTWLAAKAYDYETGGEITAGTGTSDFLDAIVGTRLIGEVSDDYEPMRWGGTGDAGLSDILARLLENWTVQKSSLGINNPQYEMTWFSLRTEAFRILPGPTGLNAWRNKLDTFRVSNLRDNAAVARLCKDLSSDELDEPALIIPLPTTIAFGKNFFGQALAGGDHQFTTTHFATKIAAAGVELVGYNLDKSGEETDVFAAQPYVYLIPAGHDKMRSPATGEVISFDVADQLLEVPNLLGSKAIAQSWSSLYKDLSGQNGNVKVRQYPAFRAVTDEEDEYEDMNATTLIGRSVWNTQWILVIPAGSLRSDRSKALEDFVWGNDDTVGVTDIKIGFTTYSHWGK